MNSFYIKLATSPCGSWLASGSSGGGVYLWDVASQSSNQGNAVELKSAGREVGGIDWGSDSVCFFPLLDLLDYLTILVASCLL